MKRQFDSIVAALDRRWPRWPLLALSLMVLVAFALRVHELARWDLTFDESASIWIARKPPPDMVRYLLGAFHEHPPTYYLSLWGWTQVAGDGEYALRFWSVLAGVLSVPLIYIWVRRLLDRGVGLIAALFLTLSPFHIYYSQDARMYALLGTLVLLSLIFFDRMLKDGRRRWWIAWSVVTLLGLSTHYFMAFINVVQTVFLLMTWRQHSRVLKPWFAIHLGVATLGGLWFLASPGLQKTIFNLFAFVTRDESLIRSLRIVSFEVAFGPVSRLSHEWLWALLLTTALGVVLAIRSQRSRAGLLIAALILVPPFLVLLTPEALASRYISYVLFGYVTALAIISSRVIRRVPVAGLAMVAIIAATGVSRYEHQYPMPKSEYGDTMEFVRSNLQDGDALILNGPWQWVLLSYYHPGDVPFFYLPPQTPPALDPLKAEPRLEAIVGDYERIWVVEAALNSADPQRFVAGWLNENAYTANKRRDLRWYYTRRGSEPLQRVPVNVVLDEMLELHQVVLADQPVESGRALTVDMHWLVHRAPEVDLDGTLALFDADQQIWAERIFQIGELFAAPSTWQDGDEPIERQALSIPVGTPPGRYTLRINVRRADSGAAFIPDDADDAWITLSEVEVIAPDIVSTASIQGEMHDVVFDERLELRATLLSGIRFSQGGWIHVEAVWSARVPLVEGLSAQIALVDSAGEAIAETTQPIAPQWYPASEWQVGEVIRSRHLVQIPPRADAARYDIRISVVTPDGSPLEALGVMRHMGVFAPYETSERLSSWNVAEVIVEELPREFALPSPQTRADARFGEQIALLGYDLSHEPLLTLKVYWQALQAIDRDLTTFTHVVAADGTIVGQSDHWPRNWSYPTSFWIDNEVIADEYTVSIDPAAIAGSYQILIGWYDSNSGERIAAVDGNGQPLANNIFLLGTITIEPKD